MPLIRRECHSITDYNYQLNENRQNYCENHGKHLKPFSPEGRNEQRWRPWIRRLGGPSPSSGHR